MKKNKIYEFLMSNGFEVSKQNTSDYFGDYFDVLTSLNFELIFSSSKSYKSINIRNLKDKGEGFDFALVKALLLNERCLNKPMDFNELEYFLMTHLEEIKELFEKQNYAKTENHLELLESERTKQMFPGKFK